MKTRMYLMAILIAAFTISSCEKEGPAGPEGLQGEQGPQGEEGPKGDKGTKGDKGDPGNANVTKYTFGEHDFSVSSAVNLDIPGITEEEMKQNAWHVYLVRPGGNVYPIPGWAVDGKTEYRIYMLHVPANNGSARIAVTIKNGTGEIYSEIIVIRVLANNTENLSSKGTKLPHIDFRDYQAVKDYYGLK